MGAWPGYSYDHAQWTLTVVVTEKEGELVATPTYSKPGILLPQTNGEAAIFVNQYHSESGEDFVQYTPAVEKSFTADSDPRPTAKPFSFSLTAMENYGSAVEMPWIGRLFGHKVTVLGQGTAYFDSIRFHQEGEYRFLLREERGRASGYTYDATRWILTVRVERSGGRLVVAQARYESEDGRARRRQGLLCERLPPGRTGLHGGYVLLDLAARPDPGLRGRTDRPWARAAKEERLKKSHKQGPLP